MPSLMKNIPSLRQIMSNKYHIITIQKKYIISIFHFQINFMSFVEIYTV